ncbi:MAG: TetR/AcrR family transcriptional regulator [Hyphomicrobiales bacterium]|nr:TetR/AcrR family transcriptional regulator [Hyphomicrobiales bacterium]
MKRTQKRTRETRDRILGVAARLFRRHGFDSTSIDQVAEAADVAKGTVFAHFGDKTNLLAAIGLAELDDIVPDTRKIAADGARISPVEDIVALYRPWLAYFARNEAFAKLFLNQAGLSTGPWTAQFVENCCELERAVERIVVDWQSRGAVKDDFTAAFYAEGAQAFFFNAVIYRLSGRTPDEDGQAASLAAFLSRWFADDRRT